MTTRHAKTYAMRKRYRTAIDKLATLKPSVYSTALVEANILAANRMTGYALEYFTLSAERCVSRCEGATTAETSNQNQI